MMPQNSAGQGASLGNLSPEKYKELFERMMNAFAYHKIVLDENGKPIDYIFIEANKAFEEMTGLKRDQIVGKKVSEVIPKIKEDPADWIGKYSEVALKGKELRMESFSADLKKWYLVYAYPPESGHFAVIFDDITKQKETELKLQKIIRLYTVLSNTNQLVLKIRDEQALFQKACEIIVNDGKLAMAWIGLVDETNKVLPVAHYGISQDYLDHVNIDLNDESRNKGPTGTAIKTKLHSVNNDFVTNPNVAIWKDSARVIGFRSSASFPLIHNNKVIGVLNIYAFESNFFNIEELKLLDELAYDISFVIEYNRQQQELETTKTRYQFALENSEQGIWDWDLVTNKVFFSDQWKTMFGYTLNEITESEMEWEKRVHPDDLVTAKQALNDCIDGKTQIYINEHRLLKKDGTYIWVLGKGKVISKDENGKSTRMIGTNIDISILKEKEADIKNVNQQLVEKIDEMEKLQKVLISRESKMIELKKKIDDLKNKH